MLAAFALRAGQLTPQSRGWVRGAFAGHRFARRFLLNLKRDEGRTGLFQDGRQAFPKHADIGKTLGLFVASGSRQSGEVKPVRGGKRLTAGGFVDAVYQHEVLEIGRGGAGHAGQRAELHQEAAITIHDQNSPIRLRQR